MSTATKRPPASPAVPPLLSASLPGAATQHRWGRLYGDALALAMHSAASAHAGLSVVLTPDMQTTERLQAALGYFAGDSGASILSFPDWETLPYDAFSPHQDIISQRLSTLYRLPRLQQGILLVPAATLMQRIAPRAFLEAHSLLMDPGDRLDLEATRLRLEQGGYRCVSQVMEHGEFAVRGSLLDLYPMGSELPYRIDLFDDEVETIRSFDPETQRSLEKVEQIRLLPAREFPLDEAGITRFRQGFRAHFEGDPQRSPLYRDVSQGLAPSGIEYYLPLFFETTATLLDYLPDNALLMWMDDTHDAAEAFWQQMQSRYEDRRHDLERPLLNPAQLAMNPAQLMAACEANPAIHLQTFELPDSGDGLVNFPSQALPDLSIKARAARPAGALQDFIAGYAGRILFTAESAGRREALQGQLHDLGIRTQAIDSWQAFLQSSATVCLGIAPLDQGLSLLAPDIALISEARLLGERAQQVRRRRRQERDADAIIRDLSDLSTGAPVVHEDHGVGRFLGLQTLAAGGLETEYLTLEYAGGDKLYVPVSSLHLISRYSGASPDNAPLHKLGGEQWQKARKRAAERVRDVAAELLEIYARRAAREGRIFHVAEQEYAAFAAAFPFEETPDQLTAIDSVRSDMVSARPMDRVVCGDVGFGKTEVAMRAAFLAVQDGCQVAVLVPTTLLAQQHYQNFCDRFADWPVKVEVLSRFRSSKQVNEIITQLQSGKVDILIGTHKLLGNDIRFKDLGLVIIDEEHRFGVRQKERLKQLRAEVDLLTLTATPIPRTLNMSLAGLRDLSVIATPPAHRLAVKTFVGEWNKATIREACLREIKRGGQVYFLHNQVESMERMVRELAELVPEARLEMAHGQMPERELERVMLDFYHRRFNLLVCSTIIESGIDVPTANTIIINRADRLGLAQLHQLRGRVGRSHHRAYAYLIAPPRKLMTADAIKRLEAVESLEDLGAGFTLATHDLEIRGTGELLGEEQSGQIHEIGFSLYTELLERAVTALKSGKEPELDRPLDHGAEIDLHIPALIPTDYLPDVHARLTLYKRIASAADPEALRELQVEMIDRFGLLPEAAKHLFAITELKLAALPLGIRKIDAGETAGRIVFGPSPSVDPMRIITLIQRHPDRYRLEGGDRLRFFAEMSDTTERLQAVERTLRVLVEDEEAHA